MTSDERLAYLTLALVPGIGPARLHALHQTFGSWSGALSAPFPFLCTTPMMNRPAATAVANAKPDDTSKLLVQAERDGVVILIPGDPAFPAVLLTIPDSPPVLFAAGQLDLLEPPAVAIVGSRNHSSYGAAAARAVAGAAARAGLVVVSGMARGLDAVAHTAALDAGGASIGVLGNGIGVIYPAANRALYARMREHGLLVSEFPPGERPTAGSFPRRNRLVSGLARVTVVVEAAAGSGALVTASAAIDQGRDVMAVPGAITSFTSVGTNRLIRDGAAPILDPLDLLCRFPEVGCAEGSFDFGPARPRPPAVTLDADTQRIAAALLEQPRDLDELTSVTGLPAATIMRALSTLELAGLAEQEAGMRFRACPR